MLGAVDALLLVLALYFIQEGEAQRHASKLVVFFVDYPDWLLPVAYAAGIAAILALALTVLSLVKRAPLGRWPWIGTGIAVLLLIVLTVGVGGPDAVRTIIDPSN